MISLFQFHLLTFLYGTTLAACNSGQVEEGAEYTSGSKFLLCGAGGRPKTIGCLMQDKSILRIGESATLGNIKYSCESRYNGAIVSLVRTILPSQAGSLSGYGPSKAKSSSSSSRSSSSRSPYSNARSQTATLNQRTQPSAPYSSRPTKTNPSANARSSGTRTPSRSFGAPKAGSPAVARTSVVEIEEEVEADDEIDCLRNGKYYHEGTSLIEENVKYTCLHGKGMQATACISPNDRSEIKLGGFSTKCGRTQKCSSTGVLTNVYDRSKDTCLSPPVNAPSQRAQPSAASIAGPARKIGDAVTDFFQGCTDNRGKTVKEGGQWKDRQALHKCINGKKHIIGCVSPGGVEIPLDEERVLDDEYIGTCRLEGTKLIFGLKING